jgi:hypothetical protein
MNTIRCRFSFGATLRKCAANYRPQAITLLAIVLGIISSVSPARAAVIFDNISNFEAGNPNDGVTATGSTPNTFMGDGYLLNPATTSITGFDIFPVNVCGTDLDGLQITIYVWQNVNLSGTVNSTTPAFSNLLATYTVATTPSAGSIPTGYYFRFEGSPVGTSPGLTLGTPLAITGTNVGITINYQGTLDGGTTYFNTNALTSLISYGTNAQNISVGNQNFSGYYRNASSEVNGNFISSLRSLGLPSQSLALRVFGTTSGGNHQPVAIAQSIAVLTNNSVNITLTATDADGDPLSYSIMDSPTNGFLSGSPPNITYTPNTDYKGPDAFTFIANDGLTDSVPALVSLTVGPGAGLIINPIWDGTILGDGNAPTIMSTIQQAIQSYELRFANPVTVNITFAEMNSGLGQSSTYISAIPYSSYYNALVAHSKTTNDTIALAHLTGGSSNPVNGGANITATYPNLRALGFIANPPGGSDSTISLNTSMMNLTRPPGDPSLYDLQSTVSHEIDEVLGTGSGVGGANIHPPDLFRYTSAGARTFTTSGDNAYFSLTGTNQLARYNQDGFGDYGDWWGNPAPLPARVQDAYGTPGTAPDLGVELIVLDSIGWDLVSAMSVPRPILQPVTLTGTTIHLSWSSVIGKSYQVQYRTNLLLGSWTNLGSSTNATGTLTSTTDSISNDKRRFYHVQLLNTPSANPPTIPAATKSSMVVNGPFELSTHVIKPSSRPQRASTILTTPNPRPISGGAADRSVNN